MQNDLDVYFKIHGNKIENILKIVRAEQNVILKTPSTPVPVQPGSTNTKQADKKIEPTQKKTKTVNIVIRRKFNFDI